MGELVTYASNGGTSEGYLALPKSGSGPAVVVIQEWWGLVPHITSVADRFAAAGFIALAPDLYHGKQTTEPDEAGKLLMTLAMDRAAKDIAGAADYLAALPGAGQQVGAVGFCAGGTLALWSATWSDRITATASFYPYFVWDRVEPDWSRYAGKAALIHCSEEDGTSAAPNIQHAHKAIQDAGGSVVLHDYPGTHHAFFNDDRPEVYNADAAASSFARTVELFRTRL
jgi:carboxymethylenebutenolidase